MQIGILALQGAFEEHGQMLDRLNVKHFEIRQKKDLEQGMDGLILPGGESTVMEKLLKNLDLYEPLRQRIIDGLPVLGTCAGLILLAKEIEGQETGGFATMDIRVRRNAYGRQLGSFLIQEEFKDIGTIPMTFIRAPYITRVFGKATVFARADGNIVAAREGNQLVTAFHPELHEDTRIHQYFCDMIQAQYP